MMNMRSVSKLRTSAIQRALSQKSTSNGPSKAKAPQPKTAETVNTNVIGLTSYVIKQKAEPLGPGASSTGDYKVPEYFCYDRFSYHGAEVELAKYRCPQPSASKKN